MERRLSHALTRAFFAEPQDEGKKALLPVSYFTPQPEPQPYSLTLTHVAESSQEN